MKHIFSGFGWELWQSDKGLIILDGEGTIYKSVLTTFEGKKWMKENKTSGCWRADGTWDWDRKEK